MAAGEQQQVEGSRHSRAQRGPHRADEDRQQRHRAFDLNNCKYRQFNARKGAISTLTYDGEFVYVYEKKDVTKLRTQ